MCSYYKRSSFIVAAFILTCISPRLKRKDDLHGTCHETRRWCPKSYFSYYVVTQHLSPDRFLLSFYGLVENQVSNTRRTLVSLSSKHECILGKHVLSWLSHVKALISWQSTNILAFGHVNKICGLKSRYNFFIVCPKSYGCYCQHSWKYFQILERNSHIKARC